MKPVERLALAVDVPSLDEARAWVAKLDGEVGIFKVGLELFSAAGPEAARAVGPHRCFLDLKLHDIPATMAKAASVVAELGVKYVTIHSAAGPAAVEAVREAVEGSDTRILAVTVLTSIDEATLQAIGLDGSPSKAVTRLGKLAIDAGAHGLVCSPQECAALRATVGGDAILMVPGIRPSVVADDDQRRTASPSDAIASGADILVVGRPIRQATDPVRAARDVVAEIAAAAGDS